MADGMPNQSGSPRRIRSQSLASPGLSGRMTGLASGGTPNPKQQPALEAAESSGDGMTDGQSSAAGKYVRMAPPDQTVTKRPKARAVVRRLYR